MVLAFLKKGESLIRVGDFTSQFNVKTAVKYAVMGMNNPSSAESARIKVRRV